MRALSSLESAGIPVMSTLSDYAMFQLKTLQQRIEVLEYENEKLRSQHSPAVVKEEGMCLAHLPLLTDVCACEHVYIYLLVGGSEMEAKLRVREEKIFDLKQQMSTMEQRNEDLKSENRELRSRLSLPPIKEEGTYMTQALL